MSDDDREDISTTEHDPLEALLATHLRAELDGHVGRAAEHFAREMARTGARRAIRLRLWSLCGVGAMAASVGIVWAMVVRNVSSRIPHEPTSPSEVVSSDDEPREVGQVVQYSTVDEG